MVLKQRAVFRQRAVAERTVFRQRAVAQRTVFRQRAVAQRTVFRQSAVAQRTVFRQRAITEMTSLVPGIRELREGIQTKGDRDIAEHESMMRGRMRGSLIGTARNLVVEWALLHRESSRFLRQLDLR